MIDLPLPLLFAALALLLILSAFFSSSETALMSISRFRLLHLARDGHRGARLAQALVRQPERLIGLILLGNNFVNILASSIATIAAVRIAGEAGVLIGTAFLTVIVLIFAEVAPKTYAALHPERIALPAAYLLYPLLRLCYPLVRLINLLAGWVLRAFGHRGGERTEQTLSQAELRTVLREDGGLIPDSHRRMLLNILALEEAQIDDIMVPRTEINGIDLDDDPAELRAALQDFPYSRAVVYRGKIDNVVGILNLRNLLNLSQPQSIDAALIEKHMRAPYFIPEGTSLTQQLVAFQRQQRRSGLVIDEYGSLQGLVTVADILEEIVGEFTTAPKQDTRHVHFDSDGSVLIDGRIPVHSMNRRLQWDLPTEAARTLSGLIVAVLEHLPKAGESLEIDGYQMHIELVRDNVVRRVRVVAPNSEDPSVR
jgi:Mg2+/Co2+ transporter CorB